MAVDVLCVILGFCVFLVGLHALFFCASVFCFPSLSVLDVWCV